MLRGLARWAAPLRGVEAACRPGPAPTLACAAAGAAPGCGCARCGGGATGPAAAGAGCSSGRRGYAKDAKPADKAKKKKAAVANRGRGESTPDKRYGPIMMQLMPTEIKFKHDPAVVADDEAKAKHFSRLLMHEHRAWQADLTAKLALKRAAVALLPPALQAAALIEDPTPFPLDRRMPTHTPDVEGFLESKQRMQDEQASQRFAQAGGASSGWAKR